MLEALHGGAVEVKRGVQCGNGVSDEPARVRWYAPVRPSEIAMLRGDAAAAQTRVRYDWAAVEATSCQGSANGSKAHTWRANTRPYKKRGGSIRKRNSKQGVTTSILAPRGMGHARRQSKVGNHASQCLPLKIIGRAG